MDRPAHHSFVVPKPDAGTRRERRKQEIQALILEAAIDLFGSRGYDSSTVEHICEHADVSRQTFYSYYPSKAHLLSALSELSAIKTPEHLLSEARAHSDNALQQLYFFIENVESNMRKSSVLERTLRRELMRYVDKFDESAATRWSYTSQVLADIIQAGQLEKQISQQYEAVFLAEMIAGTVNSIAIKWSYDESYPYPERLRALRHFLQSTLQPAENITHGKSSPEPNDPITKIPVTK
ncbi:MAG TPA: TetR/AcrR family transcriptional regulator [Spongiibacteraceae bacterium]|nr:TetR/AcrR family transcriptional regulator [Spongiibacteraceae bacterium]